MINIKNLNITIILTLLFIGCEKDTTSNVEPINDISGRSSWKIIQQEILDKSCAGCHSVGTSFGNQSELILTADVAYENLINREPHNQAAKDDGLELVGTEGLGSLYKSYLWEKINAPDKDHFYADHPQYGEIMPLGMDFLTNGQLEFIRQWIVAGAPETGVVADSLLLQDSVRFVDVLFEPLQPPEVCVQYHIGPFDAVSYTHLTLPTISSV